MNTLLINRADEELSRKLNGPGLAAHTFMFGHDVICDDCQHAAMTDPGLAGAGDAIYDQDILALPDGPHHCGVCERLTYIIHA